MAPKAQGGPAPEIPRLNLSEVLLEAEDEPSELDKIFQQLTDPRNIAHYTELSRDEIRAFSTMAVIAKKYDLPLLKEWLLENLLLRVSRGRSGRKEAIKIVARRDELESEDRAGLSGYWDRIMGRTKHD